MALAALLFAELAGVGVDVVAPPHGSDGTRQIVDLIGAAGLPDAPVFVTPADGQIVFARYLSQPVFGLPRDLNLRQLYPPYDRVAWQADRVARFVALSSGHSSAWLIYAPYGDDGGLFLDWLRQHYATTLETTVRAGDLYRIDL